MPDTKMSTTEALQLVQQQANDDGLWFNAKTAPEAHLQSALRELHAAVERTALAQQAVPQTDEVNHLMSVAADMARAWASGPAELLANKAEALEAALRTALSQAVPQAGGLSDADVPDLLVEAVTAGLLPMSRIMDDTLQQSLLTYSRAILARAGAVEGGR